ncbi:uncharacterized protein LOC144321881 isoform X2 [Canis aureus]
MATLTSLLGRTANSSCRFSSPPKREQIQVEARKSVLGEDRQPTQNPDLINAAFLLSRPTWDYNSAEGKERLQVYRQTLMAGLQAAMSKPSNLAKVYDVRQVTGRPETWPRSCWPRQWRTHRKNGRTSRSWLQGQIQLSEKLGQDSRKVGSPSHLSPPNYLENLQIFLKIYEFGLRFKERPAGTATVRRVPASIRCHQQLTTNQLQDKANNLPFGEHGELQSVLSAESSGPSGNAQFWSTAWFSPRLFPAFLPAALKPQQYRSPLSII